ncbi:hypothetical protein ACQKOD_02750 [Bacillus mycoides]|uniref:hypothetical protein n=1 Tax=Bacillus mycoides TaxID=1405 RepID=UPI003CFC770E
MGLDPYSERKTSEKNNRHELILSILQQYEVKKERDLLSLLSEKGIEISQPTIHRDLNDLGVIKNEFGIYQPNILDRINKHKYELNKILNKNKASYYPKVKTLFIKTRPGTSQAIAHHLEKIFEEIILKSTIDSDSITLLVDATAFYANDEFQQILNSINDN